MKKQLLVLVLILTSTLNLWSQSGVTLQTVNSISGSCTGSAYLIDSTGLVDQSTITFWDSTGSFSFLSNPLTDMLCEGDYYVTWLDPLTFETDTIFFTIHDMCYNFSTTVNVTNATSNLSLDGSAEVITTGASMGLNSSSAMTVSYGFYSNVNNIIGEFYESNAIDTHVIQNLYGGSVYYLSINTDYCIDSVAFYVGIDTLISFDEGNSTFIDNTNPNIQTDIDLGYTTIINCSIDYDYIDTAWVYDVFVIDSSTVKVIWIVQVTLPNGSTQNYNISNYFTNTSSLPIDQAGVYSVDLYLLCPDDTSGLMALVLSSQYMQEGGISELENKLFSINNPADDKIEILLNSEVTSIEVLNSIGSRVYYQENVEGNIEIDSSALNNGTYLVKVLDGQNMITKRIVKI